MGMCLSYHCMDLVSRVKFNAACCLRAAAAFVRWSNLPAQGRGQTAGPQPERRVPVGHDGVALQFKWNAQRYQNVLYARTPRGSRAGAGAVCRHDSTGRQPRSRRVATRAQHGDAGRLWRLHR
jgi:hypothetical protein